MTEVVDYQTPGRHKHRYILRTLTVLCLAPITILMSYALAKAILARVHSGDLNFVSLVAIVLLTTTVCADLAMMWILTFQWHLPRRWVWPVPLYITVPMNFLLPVCAGFSVSFVVDPIVGGEMIAWLSYVAALLAIVYAVLVISTCAITERDRRRFRHEALSVDG